MNTTKTFKTNPEILDHHRGAYYLDSALFDAQQAFWAVIVVLIF